MAELLAASLFAAGYLAISLEHRLFVNKAATSLLLATALWVLAAFMLPPDMLHHFLGEAAADIFGIVVFLLTAMTLVEILLHYHFFDLIESSLRARGWTYRQLGWAVGGIAFIFSAFLDNLTTTIVAIQITRRMFPKEYLIPIGALVVITANAGGAFSPIGDVTTLMLWFAQKFTATEVLVQGFVPSVVLAVIAGYIILRRVPQVLCPCDSTNGVWRASRSDRTIMAATLGSFLLPLGAATMHLPPYLGLLLGLGLVWFLIDAAKKVRPQKTHLQADIKHFLQQTDIESIQFFVGILLAVAALHALGILDTLTGWLLGQSPTFMRLVGAFVGLGASSAIIDNVPLTAAAISSLEGVSSSLWVLLALMVGTGGSMLIIGSAAGVIAMGMVPEMTFGRYLKVGTVPALVGFVAAVGVWLLQAQLFL